LHDCYTTRSEKGFAENNNLLGWSLTEIRLDVSEVHTTTIIRAMLGSYMHLKYLSTATRLHGTTCQKAVIFTVMRTSNLTKDFLCSFN
jgi:hypothetical protein